MPLLMGKRPAQPGAISWRYGDFFDRQKLTKPPLVFGHVWNDTKIDMDGNDQAGCCVWSTFAHLVQCMQRGIGAPEAPFTAQSVLSDYSAVTGYNGKPETDHGTYVKDGASYWRQTGIVDGDGKRHKIEVYVDIRINDPDELFQAAHDFGGVALGLQMPDSAVEQFEQGKPWTVPFRKTIVGGHAVALVGRNSSGHAIIATWNGIIAATPEFLRTFVDECVAFISLEYLDARGINPRGYDRAELQRRLALLS